MSSLQTGSLVVPAAWIDYNGHLNDAYYYVAFSAASEVLLDHLGIGAAYREETGSGIYTAEAHIRFLTAVHGGATLSFQTRLLGNDAKRLHVFHTMSAEGATAATCELMFLHVGRDERVCALPPDRASPVTALAAAHASLGWPAGAGQRIGIRQAR